MIKTLQNTLKQDKERFTVPKSVQDIIPIRRIWPDGVFQFGSKYSKTLRFSDINYAIASKEDKTAMFLSYSELLNALDTGSTTKITINNKRLDRRNFEQEILIPPKGDDLDGGRKEYNAMLLDKVTDSSNSVVQERYITLSVHKKNVEEARAFFDRTVHDASSRLNHMDSHCEEMDAADRLHILHDFYRVGEESEFRFDLRENMKNGRSFKDAICPDSMEFKKDHFIMGGKYGRVLFLKEYASYIKDSMINELTSLNRSLMLSIDIIPVPTDEAVREMQNRLLGVETNVTNWQRRQNANNNFSAVVPYDLEQQRKETREMLDDLTTRDQRMMFAVVTLVHLADSKEELDSDMLQSSARTAREAAVQTARYQQAAKAAQATAQKASQAAGRALRAILSAARSLAAAMMAGGSTVLSMVLVICLIGLLIASPFGIFFSGEDSGTGYTMPEAVTMLNTEFTDRIEQIKAENSYDELDMDNAGSAAMVANWRDVLAVYAVRTTTDASSPDEVATLTEEKLDILRQIFWEMNEISYWLETVPGGEDEEDTVILHIRVAVKDHLQMAEAYHFTTEQKKLLEELMQPEYEELFMRLTGSYQDIALSDKEVAEIMENLPADLSENRKQVVLTAYQLLGKVHYFWGGKSLIIGWDSRWGMPMKVTAEGSSTTGTVRPFGLDCSGMVDWVFYNQSGGQYVIGHGGGATAQHSYCTPIAWSDAQPGDLVFYPGDSHVGIVCGFDSGGNIMIIHCASGANNVVVTGKIGFTSIGRPEYFAD